MGFRDPVTSLPASAITAGQLGAGVTLPAGQVDAGALPAGVTLAAAQLSAGQVANGVTIGAAAITAGNLDPTVIAQGLAAGTVGVAQLENGAVTAPAIAASAVVAGAIAAGAIDGMIITGSTIRTAATTPRVEIDGNTHLNEISWYPQNGPDTSVAATISVTGTLGDHATAPRLDIGSPGAGASIEYLAGISLLGSAYSDVGNTSWIEMIAGRATLNGIALIAGQYGLFAGNCSSIGQVSIPHGLGAAPKAVFIQAAASGAGTNFVQPVVQQLFTASILVTCYNSSSGANMANQAVQLYWIALP